MYLSSVGFYNLEIWQWLLKQIITFLKKFKNAQTLSTEWIMKNLNPVTILMNAVLSVINALISLSHSVNYK